MSTVISWPMRCLLAQFFLAFGASGSLHAASADCEPIGRAYESQDDRVWPRVATVTHAGHYCLTQDVERKSIFDFASGGYAASKSFMWEVEAQAAHIDLRGHEIANNQGFGAIAVHGLDSSLVNGKIYAAGGYGVVVGGAGIGVFFSVRSDYAVFGMKGDLLDYTYARALNPLSGPGRTTIPRGGLRIDSLRIDAGTSTRSRFGAVAVAGQRSDNTITNSRITVSNGHAGIYLFGARQRIEGNTIVLKCSSAAPSAAPIKLHAADNSIIRNNTIVVDCWSDKPQAAISLIDSRNVVIENNRIIGVKQLYKVWDERPEQRSSVVERGNTFPTLWDRLLGR